MSWHCPQCTLNNHNDVFFCEACNLERYGDNKHNPHQLGTIVQWGYKNGFWNGFVMPDEGELIFIDGRDFHFKLFNKDRILFKITKTQNGLKAARIIKQEHKKTNTQHVPFKSGIIIEWKNRGNYWAGYIAPDDGTSKIFVDGRDFVGKLFKGDRVIFRITQGPYGAKAIDVVKQNRYQQDKESDSVAMIICNALKSLRFWLTLIVILISVVTLIVTILCWGLNPVFWSIPVLIMIWITFRHWSSENFSWWNVLISITFILVIINSYVNIDQEFRLRAVEYLPAAIRNLNDALTEATTRLDAIYTPLIHKDNIIKTIDDIVVSQLEKRGIIRTVGCFIEGTQIQVDEYGNSTNIEELRNGDFVFSPILQKQIEILWIYGNETGYMYHIMTSDLLSVIVTEKHAMKMCSIEDNVFDCGHNIAAKNVYEGNWTLTKNGYQQIVSIKRISVQEVNVYNIWLNVSDDIEISSRVVIADGVFTLDFFAQKVHEISE